MTEFDWHRGLITRKTRVTSTYKTTQNVRRFMKDQCGKDFTFSREFMAWVKDGTAKTMGQVADEWVRQRQK